MLHAIGRPSLQPMPTPSPAPRAESASAPAPVDTAVITATAAAPEPTPVSAVGLAAGLVGGAVGSVVAGWVTGVRFVGFGTVYKLEKAVTMMREAVHKPLACLPTPKIDTPFVIVPGWTTEMSAFGPLVGHLTQGGANGGQCFYVRNGSFFTRDANGDLQPAASPPSQDAKVFEMVLSDNRQSPDKNVLEMRANFDAIARVTGQSQFDVQGYSMGGINSRLYIDQGGSAIRRLMMLGTPNRGSHFANLAKNVIQRDVRWAAGFGGLQKNDVDALEWLRPEDENPKLADLNSRWPLQKTRVPCITVGTDVMPTPARNLLTGMAWGDGLVPDYSLDLPGSNTIVLHNAMQHGHLNDDETVQHIRAVYFGWDLGSNASDLFPPEDAEILKQVPSP